MSVIYIAGPISAATAHLEHQNVIRAMAVGAELMRRGWQPIIPHLSWFVWIHHDFHYERWMQLSFALLERCDALFLVAPSPGANREVAMAGEIGLPVWREIDDVPVIVSAP